MEGFQKRFSLNVKVSSDLRSWITKSFHLDVITARFTVI